MLLSLKLLEIDRLKVALRLPNFHLLFVVKLVDIDIFHFSLKLEAFLGWVEQHSANEAHVVDDLPLNVIIELWAVRNGRIVPSYLVRRTTSIFWAPRL